MDMDKFQLVTRTELIRESGPVFDNLLRGRPALIEKHSKPQAVLLDIYDFYGLQAAAAFKVKKFEIKPGDLDRVVEKTEGEAEAYALVIGHYLAEEIELSRAANLLKIPTEELTARFLRLEIPVREEEGDG